MALTALFTGSSALQANSFALDVVGNNLANLNTTGFKTQRTLFKDMMYQTLNAGSAPSGTNGGTNPSQNGFGVAVGAIDTIFRQGSVSPTGRPLDVAIQGRGFFTLTNGQITVFSRAGSFAIDAAGFLVDPNTGFRVQRTGTLGEPTPLLPGFQIPGNQDIRVPLGAGAPGTQTSFVNFQGNLSSSLAIGDSITTAIQIYDSQFNPRALTITFTKTAVNTFDISGSVSGGTVTFATTTINFDTAGLLVGPASIDMDITGIPGVDPQTITLNLGTPGQTTGLTQFGGVSTATAVTQDGTGFGTLVSVSFDNQGIMQGQFSNGRTIPLAQLAIAGFPNDGGLLRFGDNYFITSAASGEAVIGVAGAGGLGTTQGSALEGANVDIAIEFSRLIVAQRGFQVNARTISAANDTLQELANIVR